MKKTSRGRGREGEQLAARFLQQKGYHIEARNWRYKRYEVDLIACKENILVFVEVKSRRSEAFGFPEQFVNKAQASRIMEAAEAYIHERGWQGNIRFDIIAIKLVSSGQHLIEHFEDAFS
ncbi:MAG: UPF0102 protein [Thermonema sp.]|uniref:YraN family protein n=1 Tax=Thermonema sp. TaxID=2231181 RepID=UPI0021DCA3BA|nr:YraN family protein [Thermonema sp.]GIV38639.1 MAG: UPF0102 protein [Thermonema sp.]